MAIGNYERSLFVSGTYDIYSSGPDRTTLINYLGGNGFNGIYLDDAAFDYGGPNNTAITDLLNSGSAVGVVSASAVGNNDTIFYEYTDYNGTNPGNIQYFTFYNKFWDDGDPVQVWYDTYWYANDFGISRSGERVSFYVGNIQDTGSTNITGSGFSEVGFISASIRDILLSPGDGILLDITDAGIPQYNNVNNAPGTNILKRLDIIATAMADLLMTPSSGITAGERIPIRFQVNAGASAINGGPDASGYSMQSAGTYDIFETKMIKSVVDRMTGYQKKYLDFKGFVYHKYPYGYATINPHIGTGSAISANQRILKINSPTTKLSGAARTDLMNHIRDHSYTWIQFYEPNTIFNSNSLTASLALFISEARSYGTVSRAGAILGLGATTRNKVLNYNLTHPWYEHIDDFNIESEWWQYPHTADSAPFSDWSASGVSLRNTLDSPTYDRGNAYIASGGNPWIISAYCTNYVGPVFNSAGAPWRLDWVNDMVTASILVDIIDVYEGTNYRSTPDGTVIRDEQLRYIASASFALGVTTSYVPLWSAEMIAWGGDGNFMGSYLRTNGLNYAEQAWDTFTASFTFPHQANLQLVGYNYFSHKYMSRSLDTTT